MYLQMDGVDDRLRTTPNILLDKIVLDLIIDSNQSAGAPYFFDARTTGSYYAYTQQVPSAIATQSEVVTKVNGSLDANIKADTRYLLEFSFPVLNADPTGVEFFTNYISQTIRYMKAKVYDIKLLNGASLVAHYDMNTGTVQDQSGNGNHATLTGGAWVNEGGTTTPIDAGAITLSSSTNLTSSGSKRTNAQTTLQSISDLSITGAKVSTGESTLSIQTTLQGEGSRIRGNESNLQSLSNLSASGSKIMNGESQLNAITSLIAEGEILSLDISVNLSATTSLQATGTKISTGESTLSANGHLLSTGTVVYNGESILVADTNLSAILGEGLIGNITLEGSRQLNIYLIGGRELNITLQGNRQLHVTLQGSV